MMRTINRDIEDENSGERRQRQNVELKKINGRLLLEFQWVKDDEG